MIRGENNRKYKTPTLKKKKKKEKVSKFVL
jgi:hypothetical protein